MVLHGCYCPIQEDRKSRDSTLRAHREEARKEIKMEKTADNFFKSIESKINPGAKGAPARRELYVRLALEHKKHQANLRGGKYWEKADRNNSYFSAEHGFNIPAGIKRHLPSDPLREKIARLHKMHSRLVQIIKNAPAEKLIVWVKTLRINLDRIGGDRETMVSIQGLKRYLDIYQWAKDNNLLWKGKIYKYEEDTTWEKYGKKSYPRIENRRIVAFSRTGKETVKYLDKGEKFESALNQIIPNRAKKIAAQKKAETKRALSEKKVAWKILEKNGKLHSVFNNSVIYPVGRWMQEKPKSDHNGGFYCYSSKHEAIQAANNGDVFNAAWVAGKTLVLCECERKGAAIMYGNKISTEFIKITKIHETIDHVA